MGWGLEFGVWRRCRCFLAFCRAGGGVQKWPVGGKSIACPRVECFFPTPKRSQAPCPRDFQAWASCTNRQRLDPRTQNQNHPRNQLPAADWRSSPIPQRRTPTAPHTTDNFPFVFIPPPPPENKVPWPPSEHAPHLGHPSPTPTPALPLGRHRMHVQLDRCDLGASPFPPCRYRVTDGKGDPCGVSTKSLELDEAPKVAGATSHSIEAYIGVAQCSRDLRRPASRWLPARSKEAKEDFDDGPVLVWSLATVPSTPPAPAVWQFGNRGRRLEGGEGRRKRRRDLLQHGTCSKHCHLPTLPRQLQNVSRMSIVHRTSLADYSRPPALSD